MAYIIPPGYMLVAHRFSITGDPEEMIVQMGYDISESAFADTQLMINAVHNAFAGALDTSLTPQTTIIGATGYIGQDGGDPVVVVSNTAAVTGTSSGSALPPNTAVLARKVTGLAGRAGRGRMFIPGFNEAGVEPSGALVTANRTQFQNDLNAFMANFDGSSGIGNLTPVLLHTTGSVVPPTPITSLVADTKVATQRKRLR